MKKPKNTAKGSTAEVLKMESYNVRRANMVGETVFFDLDINGITVYGCKVVEGKNGDFISLPSRKGKDDKYYSIVYFRLSDEDQEIILDTVEKVLNN